MRDEWKYDKILNGEYNVGTLLFYDMLTKEQLDMLPPIPAEFIVIINFKGEKDVAEDVFWSPKEGKWKRTFCS